MTNPEPDDDAEDIIEADCDEHFDFDGTDSHPPPKTGSNGRPLGPYGCCGGQPHDPCRGRAINGTDRCYHHTNPHLKRKIKEGVRERELAIITEHSVFNDTSPKAGPIEALVDELNRTQTIVHWLGALLDEMAKSDPELFVTMVSKEVEEGTKPLPLKGHAGMLNVIRRQMIKTESGLSPFVLWYLKERDHLVRVSQLLIALGIKLDEIDFSRKQADMIMAAMSTFALSLGEKVDDPRIMDLINEALSSVVSDRVMGS